MNSPIDLEMLVRLGGIGQVILAAGSLAIPGVLGWKEDTAKLRPLTSQVFWTYAGYIWTTNVCFGLISTFGPRLLLDHTPLAGLVCGYITAYWLARVVIQFTYFDRSAAPPASSDESEKERWSFSSSTSQPFTASPRHGRSGSSEP